MFKECVNIDVVLLHALIALYLFRKLWCLVICQWVCNFVYVICIHDLWAFDVTLSLLYFVACSDGILSAAVITYGGWRLDSNILARGKLVGNQRVRRRDKRISFKSQATEGHPLRRRQPLTTSMQSRQQSCGFLLWCQFRPAPFLWLGHLRFSCHRCWQDWSVCKTEHFLFITLRVYLISFLLVGVDATFGSPCE